MELWTNLLGPAGLADQARAAEAAGWHGTVLYDSQNFNSECYVAAGVVAGATTNLKIGTGVTNPFTRHPAVTAAAAASVQVASGGRFTLGIGRGDSANASVGFAPSSVAAFEQYVRIVRRYLQRGAVSMADLHCYGGGTKRASETLHLSHTFESSSLDWWTPRTEPPPPVDVAATGPRVLELAAIHADSVSLTLGADLDRIEWALGHIRATRAKAGLPAPFRVGAYLNIACDPDEERALDLIRGPIAALARFNVMHGTTVTPVDEGDAATLERLDENYDMTQHAKSTSAQAAAIDLGFARRFAIIGGPDTCVERLLSLKRAGISRVVLFGPEPNTPREKASPEARAAQQLFEIEVLGTLSKEDQR